MIIGRWSTTAILVTLSQEARASQLRCWKYISLRISPDNRPKKQSSIICWHFYTEGGHWEQLCGFGGERGRREALEEMSKEVQEKQGVGTLLNNLFWNKGSLQKIEMSVFSLKLSQVWSWLWCQSANWSAFQLTSHCSQYSTQVNFHVLGFKSEIFHQINKDMAEAIKDQLRNSLRCQRHFTRQTSSSILNFCSHVAENPNINQDGWKFRVQKDSNMQKKKREMQAYMQI